MLLQSLKLRLNHCDLYAQFEFDGCTDKMARRVKMSIVELIFLYNHLYGIVLISFG